MVSTLQKSDGFRDNFKKGNEHTAMVYWVHKHKRFTMESNVSVAGADLHLALFVWCRYGD
jgi:hypothetical protein